MGCCRKENGEKRNFLRFTGRLEAFSLYGSVIPRSMVMAAIGGVIGAVPKYYGATAASAAAAAADVTASSITVARPRRTRRRRATRSSARTRLTEG